jgi:hypothetical protein
MPESAAAVVVAFLLECPDKTLFTVFAQARVVPTELSISPKDFPPERKQSGDHTKKQRSKGR